MGVRYGWTDDSHFILTVVLEYPWTWKEYRGLLDEIMSDIKVKQHPCATIVDVTKSGNLPKDGNIIQNLLNIDSIIPDNVFASVVVGAPYAIMVFMNMLMRLRPRASRLAIFTRTIPEAHEKIKERYAELFPEAAQ